MHVSPTWEQCPTEQRLHAEERDDHPKGSGGEQCQRNWHKRDDDDPAAMNREGGSGELGHGEAEQIEMPASARTIEASMC